MSSRMELIKLIFHGAGCRLAVWCNVSAHSFLYTRNGLNCSAADKGHPMFSCTGEVQKIGSQLFFSQNECNWLTYLQNKHDKVINWWIPFLFWENYELIQLCSVSQNVVVISEFKSSGFVVFVPALSVVTGRLGVVIDPRDGALAESCSHTDMPCGTGKMNPLYPWKNDQNVTLNARISPNH